VCSSGESGGRDAVSLSLGVSVDEQPDEYCFKLIAFKLINDRKFFYAQRIGARISIVMPVRALDGRRQCFSVPLVVSSLTLSLSESETEIKNQNRCGIFSFFFSIFW
jgi:hypothetical protein